MIEVDCLAFQNKQNWQKWGWGGVFVARKGELHFKIPLQAPRKAGLLCFVVWGSLQIFFKVVIQEAYRVTGKKKILGKQIVRKNFTGKFVWYQYQLLISSNVYKYRFKKSLAKNKNYLKTLLRIIKTTKWQVSDCPDTTCLHSIWRALMLDKSYSFPRKQ